MKQRPEIKKAKVNDNTSQEEVFQNKVLRQVIKMKHDLLILHTRQYIASKKKDFLTLNLENKLKFLKSSFERDQTFRNEVRGIVIGQFTIEEYEQYSEISNAINRRMLNIIKERMIDHLDVLSEARIK